MEVNSTVVECKREDADAVAFRFLILNAQSPSSVPMYVKLLQRYHVRHIVRACGPTYNTEVFEKHGMEVHGWTFEGGATPSQAVVGNWLDLLEREKNKSPPETIAVHCVAGLGRAPILVALALVEYGGMLALDAVGYVRARRKGAINQVQLNWLMGYRPRNQRGSEGSLRCAVM
ncbi:protein tyrosine phosphatase-like protein [Trypanosoma rangeli]|uniref:Protein tyrosine phosphatase PRL-1 n=1 Tax=Trypanosoma rangeli TaxID=5698 RepID=A0A422N2F6_TRYRA|nr:protein tyrosine phosphatase-like protein [Trypanosoma rangeli]RNE99641.1 protein tyrosine phosphatase-like protein [Trypanosoma rangeli]|eukprot:RNE99641.1 protein tyrosine phosphatase-like protein [Trypanosoma rangeli]